MKTMSKKILLTGSSQKIAATVAFLMPEDKEYITLRVISVTGGLY